MKLFEDVITEFTFSNKIKEFFWYCSGADVNILKTCPTDHNKYFGIGATVLMTAIFAVLAGSYAVYQITENYVNSILLGLFWGTCLFNIDRLLVSSIKKDERNNKSKEAIKSIPRILLAIMIAVVISKPITVKLLESNIQNQLFIDRIEEKEELRKTLEIDELLVSREELKGEVRDKTFVKIRDQLISEKTYIRRQMYEEGKTGKGPKYYKLKQDYESLSDQLENLNDRNIKQEKRLVLEIEEIEQRLDLAHQRLEEGRELIDETKQFSVFTALITLQKLENKNQIIRWISFSILFLFFVIEIVPIFVQILSDYGPYDEAVVLAEEKVRETNRIMINKDFIFSLSSNEGNQNTINNLLVSPSFQEYSSEETQINFAKKSGSSDASIEDKLSIANTLLNSNKIIEARDIILSILNQFPNDIKTLLILAKIEVSNNNYESGINILKRILKEDNSNLSASLLLSQVYVKLNSLGKAESVLLDSRKLNLSNPNINIELSKISLRKNDFENAEWVLQKALNSNPENASLYIELSKLSIMKHRYDKARVLLQKASEIDGNNISVIDSLAKICIMEGDYSNAKLKYEQILDLTPDSIEAWKGLYKSFQLMNEDKKAEEALTMARRLEEKQLFKDNLKKEIVLQNAEINKILFFEDITWQLQAGINILLGKNGYGKTLLLRIIISLLQKDNETAFNLLSKSKEKGGAKIDLIVDGEIKEIFRSKAIFEKDIGMIPVLAISDVRSIDKSNTLVSYVSDERLDLLEYGASGFLNNKPDEYRIKHFLYQLCVKFLDNGKSFELEIFYLLEEVVQRLTSSKFKFHSVEVIDDVAFRLNVVSDNSKTPIPFQKVSQGTLSTLAIFGIIYNYLKALNPFGKIKFTKGIVFIDEIDAHLHPDWQQKIVPLLRENFPSVQFILSAHSPLVVAGCYENEVAVLRRKEEGQYSLFQFEHDFIGWEASEVYEKVFEIEDKDETYLKYGLEYTFRESVISRIEELEDKEDLSEDEEKELDLLFEKEKYFNRYKASKDIREQKINQEEIIQDLREEVLLLEEELNQFKKDNN